MALGSIWLTLNQLNDIWSVCRREALGFCKDEEIISKTRAILEYTRAVAKLNIVNNESGLKHVKQNYIIVFSIMNSAIVW